jgi:hypothetical protein
LIPDQIPFISHMTLVAFNIPALVALLQKSQVARLVSWEQKTERMMALTMAPMTDQMLVCWSGSYWVKTTVFLMAELIAFSMVS